MEHSDSIYRALPFDLATPVDCLSSTISPSQQWR